MEFNVNKYVVMHVGGRDDSSTYYIKGSELTKVNYKKRFGCLDIS